MPRSFAASILVILAAGSCAAKTPATGTLGRGYIAATAARPSPPALVPVAFDVFGFQLKLPPESWSADLIRQPDNRLQIILKHAGSPFEAIVVRPFEKADTDAAAIVSAIGALLESQGATVSVLQKEYGGRCAIIAESTMDGLPSSEPTTTYVGVAPHPSKKGTYVVFVMTVLRKDSADSIASIRAIADTLAALP